MAEEKAPPTEEITENDKLMAALSYIIVAIVPLIILLSENLKDRPYQRYHAITSLALMVVFIIYEAVISLFYCGATVITGGILGLCLWIVFFVPFIPALYYAYLAYQGQYFDIPVVTDFIKNQGWV
ncbi:MAG: DUF4870 domain-containing protein [Anaerolineae bacterium]